jgi:enterochelin esterase-like enzyme
MPHKLPGTPLCFPEKMARISRRALAPLGAAAALVPVAVLAQSAPVAPRLKLFPPKAPPFDERGRRQLAEDALLFLWEVHGERPGRPVFSLPRSAILGTLEGIYLPRWEMTVPAGMPIYLPAFIRADRKFDPGLTRVVVDGSPVSLPAGAVWQDYLYAGVRAPIGSNIFEMDVLDLVFAPPPAGRYRIDVQREELSLQLDLIVRDAHTLGPLVLRDPEGTLWALQGEQRRAAPDPETITALGYGPGAVRDAAAEALSVIPVGNPLPSLRDGALPGTDSATVQTVPPALTQNTLLMSPAGDIYHVDNGDLRHVPSFEWLAERGLAANAVARVPAHVFATLPFNREHGLPAGVTRMDRSFSSAALGVDMPYRIFLPPGYSAREQQGRRYPVAYLLHGRGARYTEWSDYDLEKRANDLFSGDPQRHAIFVLAQGSTGYWANQQNGPRWGDYVAKDLVAHIDSTYRTVATRPARAIGGLSMGGHGSLQLALNFPETFGVVGARGPSLHTRETVPGFFGGSAGFHLYDPLTLLKDKPPAQPLVVWLDVGDQDPWRSLIERLFEEIKAKGWSYEWHVYPGAHTNAYWNDNVAEYYGFFQRAFAKTGGQSTLSLA